MGSATRLDAMQYKPLWPLQKVGRTKTWYVNYAWLTAYYVNISDNVGFRSVGSMRLPHDHRSCNAKYCMSGRDATKAAGPSPNVKDFFRKVR
jgi:hypothetical protein